MDECPVPDPVEKWHISQVNQHLRYAISTTVMERNGEVQVQDQVQGS